MRTIESIVQSEIQDFIHNPITVADGYEFNQYENVKKTHLYLNSQFYRQYNTSTDRPLVDGVDQSEDDRIFFNVTTPRVKAVERFFDVDVADIVIDEIDPNSEKALQLLNKDFDRFAEEHNLSKDLNMFKQPLIRYGSLVIKVLKNRAPEIIPLNRLFLDPSVKNLSDSRFVTIKHTMTPEMLREKVKDGWDEEKVEELIKSAGKTSNASNTYEDEGGTNKITSSVLIDVYERYGYAPEYMINGGDSEKEIMTLSVTGLNDAAKQGNKEVEGACLYKTEWTKDIPLLDTHLAQTEGRWQGIGIPELLYPIQQRMNEVCNQKRISMEISSLHLFQSSDPGTLNNILTDLENGDVIQSKAGLTPLANEERNLPAFDSEIVTYQSQGDKLSFANDLLSGGDIASSTPATNAVIQNNNQVLVHLQDRENFTNFIANEYVKKYVVPKLIKDMSDEHFLRIVSDSTDLVNFDDDIVAINKWQIVKERAMKGQIVDALMGEDLEREIRQKLQSKGPNRYVKVLKDYYKNKIGDIIVHIGNEKKDMAKVANNQLSFMQMLQDPSMVEDPVKRVFLTDYARSIGIDTARLEVAYAKRDAAMREQGMAEVPQQAPRKAGVPAPQQEVEDEALAKVL